MSDLSINIDPLNPGQFYACAGLMELLSFSSSNLTSRFLLNEKRPRRGAFEIRSADAIPLPLTLENLRSAGFASLLPLNHDPSEEAPAATLPIEVSLNSQKILLDWWLDEFQLRANSLKCWAGQVTSLRLFTEIAQQVDPAADCATLFDQPLASSTRFGVDPRSSWNALDAGYSPNEQNQSAIGYPIVEILAAFGLQRFRPLIRSRENVPYHLWREWLPLPLAAVAANAPWPGLPSSSFAFSIELRGQSYKYLSFGRPIDAGR